MASKIFRCTAAVVLLIFVLGKADLARAQVSGGPSANCHVTDGTFTVCPNGKTEWSDVTPVAFPASSSYLYVNQDASHSFLYLMYDLPVRTTPLSATDSVHINFDTVETQLGVPALVVYDIFIFGNGQMQVLQNGQPTPAGRIVGAAGFGISPNSATPHVTSELQVPLAAGPPSTYSPDPLFWGASVPPTPPPPPPCSVMVLGVCIKTQAQVATWNQEADADNAKADALSSLAQEKAADVHNAAPACLVAMSALGAVLVAQGISKVPEEQAAEALTAALAAAAPEVVVPAAGAVVAFALLYTTGNNALVLAATAAEAACSPLEVAAGEWLADATEAAADYALAQGYLILARDPPDPNFTVIAAPVIPSLSVLPLTTATGFSSQVVSDYNSLLSNLEQQIALLRVIPISMNRVSGAIVAGNAFWQGQQTQAVQKYASQLVPLLQNELSLRTALANDFASSGVTFTFSANDVANALSLIKQNGFPAGVANALTQLGVDAPTQSTILQTALSTDPVLVASLGTGVFPQAFSDPSFAAATNDSINAFSELAPPLDSLTTSFSATIPGDYVANGVGLRGGSAPFFGPPLTTAPINISGVPAGATILRAFLYWGVLDNGLESSLSQLSVNGTPVNGSLIGIGPDTCWGRTNSFTFRADVTRLVAGNGTYTLTGIATGGNILPDGASLVVIYEAAGLPTKTVILADGNVSIPLGTSKATTTFTGFSTAAPLSAFTTFMVGDGQAQQFGTTPVTFAGSLGTISLPGLFSANNGPLWDTDTFNVSSVVGAGNSSDSATITVSSDCLLWSAQAFSVTSTPVTTPVSATAAVVEANANGDTVANLRGLAPTDAPTLQDQIQMIVQFRVIQNPSTDVTQLTTQLVNSLPSTILPPSQAAQIISSVAKQVVIPPVPITTATPSPGPNTNGWNNTNVSVTFSSVENVQNGPAVRQINVALSGAQSGSIVLPGATGSVQITAEGITTVTYFGIDSSGNQEAPKTLTVKIDKTPPVISGMPAPGCTLWPPNHEPVQVATVTASDALSGLAPGTFTLTGTSNEPIAPTDPMFPDTIISQTGPASFSVQLRAERLGTGTGRIYTLSASASDLAGNTANSTATCTVPHDQGQQ